MNQPSRPRRKKKAEVASRKRPLTTNFNPAETVARALVLPTDKTNVLVAEAVQYWNDNILSVNVPAHAPFRREDHKTAYVVTNPGVMQHLLLVSAWTIRISQAGSEPLNNHDLCHYRGLAFRQLQTMLPKAIDDPTGQVLACAIMALVADFGLSQHAAREAHIRAVRKIMMCRGGFQKGMEQVRGLRQLYLTFMISDVLLATLRETCHLDADTVAMQAEYILLLPDLESQLVYNADVTPQAVVQAMIRLTALRHNLRQDPDDLASQLSTLQRVSEVYSDIENFDARRWAETVTEYGKARPQRLSEQSSTLSLAAWTTLGLCFRSAALLYLLISVPCGNRTSAAREISEIVTVLDAQIGLLFEMADTDPDATIETQLWKFLNWPLLMLLRAHQTVAGDGNLLRRNIRRLQMIARATGIRSWLDLASLPVDHKRSAIESMRSLRLLDADDGLMETY